MKILLIFTFFLIIAGTDAVTTVTGYRGRSVQIKCPYESGYEKNNKFICRGECPFVGYRDIPVQSGSPPKDTRFSLYDNTTARVFIITITDLRTEDEGTYWCTIHLKRAQDIYTEILLLVKTGFQTTLVISAVSVVLVLLIVAFIFIVMIQRKKKTQGSETVRQSCRETNEEYENDLNLPPVQARENTTTSQSVYQSLSITPNQSDSVYQSLSITNNQSDSVYQSLSITNNQSDSVYQSLSITNNQSDSVYQSLSITNNQSDSVYQSLSITNNQSDSVYQSLSHTNNQ
ncbi:CMRF35-like molecule 1 [Hemibagrus wyckioides]|uniref:CMRF35-like molecule 1 n=1 Tax=Hemibagrus wyckioides TaxID=337641 RepID=UPI00266DAC97|nr:CMRF35-like molecule 1 [Hemibagrus wyckioides]